MVSGSIRCRVEPYWIKAATLRAAAPGRAHAGRAAWGPTRRGAPGMWAMRRSPYAHGAVAESLRRRCDDSGLTTAQAHGRCPALSPNGDIGNRCTRAIVVSVFASSRIVVSAAILAAANTATDGD